ncbi:MAG: hypothetical protein HS128_19255 [Ideonella sp.]|nr:hypothetical protein [Ideonella sp.]MCC7455971.1 hypothetical protein [Nitrospira sp.]
MDAPPVAEVRTPREWLAQFEKYRVCKGQWMSKAGWAHELLEAAERIFEGQEDGKRNLHG